MRSIPLISGAIKCSCGQKYQYETEKEMQMKLRMPLKICPSPMEGCEKFKSPTKSMMMEEQRRFRTERNRRFHN